jgi:GxxExxY protein
MRPDDSCSEQIIGACIEIHKEVGPGLLESVYAECLAHELTLRGLDFETEIVIPIVYKGEKLDANLRIDFVVEQRIIVELKSVEHLLAVHSAQLLTYLKLTPYDVGLLVNFNVALLRHGLRRLEKQKMFLPPPSSL